MRSSTDVAVLSSLWFGLSDSSTDHKERQQYLYRLKLTSLSSLVIEELHTKQNTVRIMCADRPVRTSPDPRPTQWHLNELDGGVKRRA